MRLHRIFTGLLLTGTVAAAAAVGTSLATPSDTLHTSARRGAAATTGSIDATVFDDAAKNTTVDAVDTLIAEVEVRAFPAGAATGSDPAAFDRSDSDGRVVLEDLAPGEYTVEWASDHLVGWTTPRRLVVTVGAGATTEVVFGLDLGAVMGSVWSDDDRDFVRDDGEAAVAGIAIGTEAIPMAGFDADTITDADGNYRIDGLDGFPVYAITAPTGSTAIPTMDRNVFAGASTGGFLPEGPACVGELATEPCLLPDIVDFDFSVQPLDHDIALTASPTAITVAVGQTYDITFAAERKSAVTPPADLIVDDPDGIDFLEIASDPLTFWVNQGSQRFGRLSFSCILPPCGPEQIGPYSPLTLTFQANASGTYTIDAAMEIVGAQNIDVGPERTPGDNATTLTVTVVEGLPATR